MNNLKCLNQNHHNKEITTVCLDKNCKEKRLSCLLCLVESHNSHQKKSVEVKQLTSFIEQESKRQNTYPESCSFGQKQIIQGLEKLITLIDSLQKVIKEKIEIIKQQNLQDYLKKANNKQEGIEQWNQLLEGILQYVQVDNCVINLTITKEAQLSDIEDRQNKIIQQSEEKLQNMIQLIDNSKQSKLHFDENRKHPDIAIISENIIKQTKGTSYSMAFASDGFDPSNQSFAFAFNLQNFVSEIFVGVGNSDKGKEKSFMFNNYSTLGHGQYMIYSRTNYTFHHSDQEINHKQKGIAFKTGDQIQIKYDHVTKVLEFKKQSEQDTIVKMLITDLTKILYPCAFLTNPDDQVQLVEY